MYRNDTKRTKSVIQKQVALADLRMQNVMVRNIYFIQRYLLYSFFRYLCLNFINQNI